MRASESLTSSGSPIDRACYILLASVLLSSFIGSLGLGIARDYQEVLGITQNHWGPRGSTKLETKLIYTNTTRDSSKVEPQ